MASEAYISETDFFVARPHDASDTAYVVDHYSSSGEWMGSKYMIRGKRLTSRSAIALAKKLASGAEL